MEGEKGMSKSIKKVLALMLVLTMLMPLGVSAADDATFDDAIKLYDKLVESMFSQTKKDKVANFIDLVYKIQDRSEFVKAYEKMYQSLSNSNKASVDAYGASLQAMKVLVEQIEIVENNMSTNNISIGELTGYIRSGDKAAFRNTLTKHKENIGNALKKADVTTDELEKGFNKMDAFYKSKASIYIKQGKAKIFIYDLSTKNISLDYVVMKDLLEYITEDEEKKQVAITATNDMISYFNSSTSNDKGAVKDFLEGENLLSKRGGTSPGGGSSGGGGGSSAPSTGSELNDLAKDLAKGNTTPSEVAEKMSEIAGKVGDKIAKVNSESAAYSVLKDVSGLLVNSRKVAETVKDEAAIKAIINDISELVDSTAKVLDIINNASTVEKKAKALLEDIAAIKKAVKGENASKLAEKSFDIAQVAVKKAGTVKIASFQVKTKKGLATANLSEVKYDSQIKKAETSKKKMNDILDEDFGEATQELDLSLQFNIPTLKSVVDIDVTLPSLTKAFKVVDSVSIKSDVASFDLTSDTFNTEKNIRLTAKTIKKDSLDESLRDSLPENVDEVIDLSAYVDEKQVSSFNSTITVSVPYDLVKNADVEKNSFYLLTDKGTIKKVGGVFDPIKRQIIVKRTSFSKYFAKESNETFNDIYSFKWARQAIEVMAGKGIIDGVGNGRFNPNGELTRAELVTLVSRMLQLEPTDEPVPFDDLEAGRYYVKPVIAAYQNGLIDGVTPTKFDPNAIINRMEAATLISNVIKCLGYDVENDGAYAKAFVDYSTIPNWARAAVATVYKKDIISGKPGNIFDPNGNSTRAEAVVMIYRIYFNYYY